MNKNNGEKQKRIWVFITLFIILLVIIVLIPFLIDWLIIGNSFPSNISNSDWVSFFGGYIGAIIGALISMSGIILTILFTKSQSKEDHELQIRPYCSIRFVPNDIPREKGERVLGILMLKCEPSRDNSPRYNCVIYVKNIGLGPAIDFKCRMPSPDDGRNHSLVLHVQDKALMNSRTNILIPGEEAFITLSFFFNFDPILKEDLIEIPFGEDKHFVVDNNIGKKYKNFECNIELSYCDMFDNKYSQTVTLFSQMGIRINQNEMGAEHTCELYLREVSRPIKIKQRGR